MRGAISTSAQASLNIGILRPGFGFGFEWIEAVYGVNPALLHEEHKASRRGIKIRDESPRKIRQGNETQLRLKRG